MNILIIILIYDTKVTVVVPIYNTVEYLSKCINSITNQTYRNLEILLINDGSTDESLKLCELLADKDNRIKIVNQCNQGLAETRNRGIELATGEYICFIDSDDYIDNKMIETLLKTAQQTNADVCEGSFYIHMKNGFIKDVTCEQKGVKFVKEKLDLINAYSDATILIPVWDKIYKLSSIKAIKFDKECFKEDSDYIFRLCMEGKKFALVPIPFYHYVKRKSVSITGNKISPRLFTLKNWGIDAYNKVLSQGEEYRDAAEKILYNSLVHILRNFMRDYKNNVLEENEFQEEIQDIINDIINLLLRAKNVKKFRKLDEVLSIINELTENNIVDKEKMPSIEIPCVGILWNSLNKEMMEEANKKI
jgi:glycosyltransferase involved in cell wall biosynthesis